MSASDGKAPFSAEDLSSQIDTLRAEIARITTAASGNIAEGVGIAQRKIWQTGRKAQASAAGTVLDHPLATVGIAAALGFLLGMIARRG